MGLVWAELQERYDTVWEEHCVLFLFIISLYFSRFIYVENTLCNQGKLWGSVRDAIQNFFYCLCNPEEQIYPVFYNQRQGEDILQSGFFFVFKYLTSSSRVYRLQLCISSFLTSVCSHRYLFFAPETKPTNYIIKAAAHRSMLPKTVSYL